jgi:uncharacterized small protein (DUF1192 family)
MTEDELESWFVNNKYKKHNDTYDYLSGMSIKNMTKTRVAVLKSEVQKLEIEIKTLNNTMPNQIWLNELIELEKSLN